jgi:two-component system, NarL family, sensor histidine kinase DesK
VSAAAAGPAPNVAAGSPARGNAHPPWTVRRARQVMIAAHVPVIAIAPALAISGVETAPARYPVVPALLGLAMGAVQLRHSLAAARGERPRFALAIFLMLAVLVYVPMVWFGWAWAASQALLVASAAMMLRGRLALLVCAAACLGTVALAEAEVVTQLRGAELAANVPFMILFWGTGILGLGLSLYGTVWLVRVVGELQVARTELAELGIGRERLRVSRDLHDLLGQSLSAVSLKADLAVRLLHTDTEAAREQIEDLRGLARGALHDVRTLARDEHAVSLRTETDGAAALLAAAGIRASITVSLPGLPAPAEQVLAWAVREGVTNMLRHSDARTCSITGTRDGGTARLEIVNDRARPAPGDGDGLVGLAERARSLSGSVSGRGTGDGGYRLVVEIPWEQA